METYHRARLPDATYDVDGDGVVSVRDLYLASKFDVNGDGILQVGVCPIQLSEMLFEG